MIRYNVDIPDEAYDPLQLGCSYGQSDSVLEEMIPRLDHVNTIFMSDNASIYSMMEEAAQGNVYAPTIKPYTQNKNGRAAWKAMVSYHADQDKWEQLQKEKLNFMIQTKWNVRVYSLEKFFGLHRNSFVQPQEGADHVNF